MRFVSIFINSLCKYRIPVLLSLGGLIFASYLLSFLYGGINQDMTYYMNTVKLMVEGYIPYRDFDQGYTPLAYYLLYLPVLCFGNQIYTALSCAYIALLIDAYLVYRICCNYSNSKALSVFGALLFILLSRVFESDCFYLEPFVLIPGLLSILLIDKGKYYTLFSGFLCFAAFWTKQYGIGFLGLMGAYILIDGYFNRNSYLRLGYLLLGFLLGGCFFIGCMLTQGVEWNQMFGLSGASYAREGWFGLWCGLKALIKYCFPLLIWPFVSFSKSKPLLKSPFFLISISGIGCFVLQTFVRPYGHYLILMAPFCVFAIVCSYKVLEVHRLVFFQILCSCLSILLLFNLIKSDYRTINEVSNLRQYCLETSQELESYIPRGSQNVYASSDIDRLVAYYLETTPPITKGSAGLNFEASKNAVDNSVLSADYIISHSGGDVALDEDMFSQIFHIEKTGNLYICRKIE